MGGSRVGRYHQDKSLVKTSLRSIESKQAKVSHLATFVDQLISHSDALKFKNVFLFVKNVGQ